MLGALGKNTQSHAQSNLMEQCCDVSIAWGKNKFLQITENQKCFPGSKNLAKKKKRTQSCMNDKQIQFTFRHVALSHRGVHATFLFYDSKYNGVFATSQKVWSPSCMSLFPWSFKQVRPIPWISSFSDDEKQSRCKGYTFLKFK